jgi:hypothetical protein
VESRVVGEEAASGDGANREKSLSQEASSEKKARGDQAMDNRTEESSAARVYLQPIAAPSILGLYAFAGSTLIVATELAGW